MSVLLVIGKTWEQIPSKWKCTAAKLPTLSEDKSVKLWVVTQEEEKWWHRTCGIIITGVILLDGVELSEIERAHIYSRIRLR